MVPVNTITIEKYNILKYCKYFLKLYFFKKFTEKIT